MPFLRKVVGIGKSSDYNIGRKPPNGTAGNLKAVHEIWRIEKKLQKIES
jgi:hypothetical protein